MPTISEPTVYSSHSLMQDSDDVLLASARRGSEAAFSELTRRHTSLVLRTTLRITRNREDAEDAMQDTFLRAYTHLNQFDGRAQFSTWLTRIGMNAALGILRKRRTSRETTCQFSPDEAGGWQDWDVADPRTSQERTCVEDELRVRIQQEIACLPITLRNVIEHLHREDCSILDVSTALGISLPAAKSRLVRARGSILSVLR